MSLRVSGLINATSSRRMQILYWVGTGDILRGLHVVRMYSIWGLGRKNCAL